MHTYTDLPKVLVIGINAWREDATAHTLMNIFKCWDPDKLALIYTRADLPDTEVCHRYFQISESKILHTLGRPWKKIGNKVENTRSQNNSEILNEHERYKKMHKVKLPFLPLAREFVWKFGNWKSPALKSFIDEFNPDIIFAPIYPVAFMGRLQRYIADYTGKPVVGYLADDNYSYDSCHNIWNYTHRFWLRKHVGNLARRCKEIFVIVDKEKEDTDTRFNQKSVILTKGIDFSKKSYREHTPKYPIRFVYTGNLIIGRGSTLAMLAEAINEINADSVKAELFIYSQTEPDAAMLKKLNNGASHFCGFIDRNEVDRVQEEADVVVFAESLRGKTANAAQLSFSTKITDYLANGKCILAIGREYIAPIDYFRRNDSAIIANSEEEIVAAVKKIVESPQIIKKYGKKAYDCAVRNHKQEDIDKRFIETMKRAIAQD